MPTSEQEFLSRRARNMVHSALLSSASLAFGGVIGWGFASWLGVPGIWGLAWVGGAMLSFLLVGRQMSSRWVFRLYQARPLSRQQAPQLTAIVEELARRAELPHAPRLYYIASPMVNAFAAGTRGNAGIGVTHGILRNLDAREIAGVLAHEISHLAHGDLTAMGLADVTTRVANTVSWIGQIILIINLPLYLIGAETLPWLLIALMIFAPTISALLQLALSRSREFDADLSGAHLTGDPRGLASALKKMERLEGGFVERLLLPGRRIPEPSLLRTHPDTEERVRRLLALEGIAYQPPPAKERLSDSLERLPAAVRRRPRWHASGLWY
ncbi:MAG: zinc metalloprotease HtpX [Acidobacteriota bacterium]|jgi:heat shock protein HtpX